MNDWRKAFERVQEWLTDLEQIDDPGTVGLGKRRAVLEKMLAALKQYPALEARLADSLDRSDQASRQAERASVLMQEQVALARPSWRFARRAPLGALLGHTLSPSLHPSWRFTRTLCLPLPPSLLALY